MTSEASHQPPRPGRKAALEPHDSGSKLGVSVVVPAYNCAAFLGEALDSVLAQTRPVDEIVVVDDGSTDDTMRVARSYESAGVRCLQQRNQGPAAARNVGIHETGAEIVGFLDADDTWVADKVGKQVSYFAAHRDVALVSSDVCFWNVQENTRTVLKRGFRRHSKVAHEIAVRNAVGNTSAVMVRRRLLEAVGGFDASLRWGEDWDLWARVLLHGRAGFVHEPLVVYRWHSENNSHDRRWEQLDVLSDISRRAIQRARPGWWLPILHARRVSYIEAHRAAHAISTRTSRWRQILHATAALATYPLEDTVKKLTALLRAIAGDRIFWWLSRRRVRGDV